MKRTATRALAFRGSLRHNPSVNSAEYSSWIIEQARGIGFDLCGVTPAEDFEELAHLPEWLTRDYCGEMDYLRDERRASPARALQGARSVIVCALNYNTPLPYSTEVPAENLDDSGARGPGGPRGWISRYAWGDDYHQVLREKLEALLAAMRRGIPQAFDARIYADTGPIVERVAAKYAGLGWLAKNTCLIHPQLGSWLFLGVILTTLPLDPPNDPASPPPDLCGNCRLCIEACPTGAIVEPYVLDARKCISYLTIELRGSIPADLRQPMGRHVFGCDICQDICPWNRAAPTTSLAEFLPRTLARRLADEPATSRNGHSEPARAGEESLFAPELERLIALGEEEYREVFRGSAIKRAKWRGLVRNACVALGNSGVKLDTAAGRHIAAQLERLAACADPLIAEHARWALARLGRKQGTQNIS